MDLRKTKKVNMHHSLALCTMALDLGVESARMGCPSELSCLEFSYFALKTWYPNLHQGVAPSLLITRCRQFHLSSSSSKALWVLHATPRCVGKKIAVINLYHAFTVIRIGIKQWNVLFLFYTCRACMSQQSPSHIFF